MRRTKPALLVRAICIAAPIVVTTPSHASSDDRVPGTRPLPRSADPDGDGAQQQPAARVQAAAVAHLSDWLRTRTERFEVIVDKAGSTDEAPSGRAEYRARPFVAGTQPTRRMSLWIDAWLDGRVLQSHVVTLTVKALTMAWVANTDLAAGSRLHAGAFTPALVDAAEGGAWPLNAPPDGARLRSGLLKGRYLRAHHLASLVAVARGDRVELSSRVGDIEIRAEAQVLQDGQVGERIAVRVPNAKGPVYADVLAPGRAVIAR